MPCLHVEAELSRGGSRVAMDLCDFVRKPPRVRWLELCENIAEKRQQLQLSSPVFRC